MQPLVNVLRSIPVRNIPKAATLRISARFVSTHTKMASIKDGFLPWTQQPLIINAPMADNAGGLLAATVTLAGGFGLIGSKTDMNITRRELNIAKEKLAVQPNASSETLNVGVGFLPFILKLESALEVVKEFKPAVVWLFATKEIDDYAVWARAMREVSPKSQVWVQAGSVASALQIAEQTKPDALCLQGIDAGGHGFEKGAGIVSLLPETADALEGAGYKNLPLLASGGIMDGRGVAAALSLGAAGVVMGTRFLASKEALVHPNVQASILEAKDGGQVTTRSKLFDQLRGPNIWPEVYDGRSLVIKSHKEFVEGVSLEDIQKRHNEALEEEDLGWKTGLEGRAAIWAGSGVGLVSEVESATSIVETVRDDAKKILSRIARI
jgi:nitronate monooxygenase